jgi:hypothetical protein
LISVSIVNAPLLAAEPVAVAVEAMRIGADDPDRSDAEGVDVGAIKVRGIRRNAASRIVRIALAAWGRRPGRRPALTRRNGPERIEHCPGTGPPEPALRGLGALCDPHE